MIIRPGALGDAVLTLPVLAALARTGTCEFSILGTLPSWRFLRPDRVDIRACDFASTDWLGLFSPAVPLSATAQRILEKVSAAIVFLNGDTQTLSSRLRSAGVQTIITSAVPQLDERLPAAPEGVDAPPAFQFRPSVGHAALRMLGALDSCVGTSSIEQALHVESLTEFVRVDPDEQARVLQSLDLSAPPSDGLIAFHPGSGGRTKCWPAERYAELASAVHERTGATPLVFFGPADGWVRGKFEGAMRKGIPWQAVVERPLREVCAILSLCKGYVGNDAGVGHLAAQHCPVLSLFGPTDWRVWAPLGEDVTVMPAPQGELFRLDVASVLGQILTRWSNPGSMPAAAS